VRHTITYTYNDADRNCYGYGNTYSDAYTNYYADRYRYTHCEC